jgi:hypothetical protein
MYRLRRRSIRPQRSRTYPTTHRGPSTGRDRTLAVRDSSLWATPIHQRGKGTPGARKKGAVSSSASGRPFVADKTFGCLKGIYGTSKESPYRDLDSWRRDRALLGKTSLMKLRRKQQRLAPGSHPSTFQVGLQISEMCEVATPCKTTHCRKSFLEGRPFRRVVTE